MDDSTHFDVSTGSEPAGLQRARTLSHLLDDAWRIPGTDARIGLDPLISVVPVGGDVVAAAVSLYVVYEAWRLDVSWPTLVRMLANVAIDVTGGSVPVLGTVFDAEFKANQRNVELLEAEFEGSNEAGPSVDAGTVVELEDISDPEGPSGLDDLSELDDQSEFDDSHESDDSHEFEDAPE